MSTIDDPWRYRHDMAIAYLRSVGPSAYLRGDTLCTDRIFADGSHLFVDMQHAPCGIKLNDRGVVKKLLSRDCDDNRAVKSLWRCMTWTMATE